MLDAVFDARGNALVCSCLALLGLCICHSVTDALLLATVLDDGSTYETETYVEPERPYVPEPAPYVAPTPTYTAPSHNDDGGRGGYDGGSSGSDSGGGSDGGGGGGGD